MNIYYLTPYCVLRAATNQIGDVRLCEGFAENGADVELISLFTSMPYNLKRENVFEAYGIRFPYHIRIMKTPLRGGDSKYLFAGVQLICAFVAALRIFFKHASDVDHVYVMSRSLIMLMPFLWLKKVFRLNGRIKVLPWIHEVPAAARHRWVLENADAVIGTNSAITEAVHQKMGIPHERLAVSLNPIATSQKELKINKAQARKALGLRSNGKTLVVYTGKVGVKIKEIEYILEAASRLPACDFLFTGGKPEVVAHYQAYCRDRGITNVAFSGFLDNYRDVIYYQYAADILVSYYTRDLHAVEYNFPNKICEYMLTGNAIVTPDFPATRDVLHEGNAFFVEPERTEALVDGIRTLAENPELAERLGRQARADVEEVTFQKRTEHLMAFFAGL